MFFLKRKIHGILLSVLVYLKEVLSLSVLDCGMKFSHHEIDIKIGDKITSDMRTRELLVLEQ